MLKLSQYYPTNIGLETLVYKTGDQSISGIKNFLFRPTVNGSGVALLNEVTNISDIISSKSVLLTGDQTIFDNKKFENITNLQGSPFLASGVGKYIEKYFNVNLSSGNIVYNSPKYRNSFIFIDVNDIRTYSIYLPSVTGAIETDYIKYIINELPTGINNTIFNENELSWRVTGCPTIGEPNCPGCIEVNIISGVPVTGYKNGTGVNGIDCITCLSNCFQEGSGYVSGFTTSNSNSVISGLIINFYTDSFVDYIVSGSGVYTGYNPSILIYSLYPNYKDNISFLFRNGAWDIENTPISLEESSIPVHFHSIDDILDFPYDLINTLPQNSISSERYFYHTFSGGNSNTLQINTGRNSVIDFTFETNAQCNILLPNPASGGVITGDRILCSIVSISGTNQNIPLNFKTNLFQNNTYSNYTDIFTLNLIEINDGVEFIFKGTEWKIRFPTIGKPVPYAHGHNAAQISFSGNRTVTRQGLPSFIGGDDIGTFLNNYFFPFLPSVISLQGYPLQEKGVPLQNIRYTGNIVQNQETIISNLQLLKNGTVINTISTPSFGNFNYLTTESLSSDGSIGVNILTNNNGSPINISSTQNILFEAPMYFGVGVAGMGESLIKLNLTKQVESKSSKTRSFTATNQKLYIVVPQNWNLISIIDGAGFNNFPGWGPRQSTFTLANGSTQIYNIWETLNLNTVNNFSLTFNFN